MSLNLKTMIRALKETDTIITPRLQEWLVRYGDDRLSDEVANTIHDLLTTAPRVRSGSFSASSAGQCPRAQVLSFLGASGGVTDVRLQNIFSDGKWRHMRWQYMLLSAGILTDIEDPQMWPRMRTRGTMDGIGVVPDDHPRLDWRGKEFVFELKGVSAYLYPKYKEDGPKEEDHLPQVARYLLMTGFPLAVIIYEDKSTQDWTEWVIEATDPRITRLIEEQRQELEWLNHCVDQKDLPQMLPGCASRNGSEWKTCPFAGPNGPCVTAGTWPKKGTPGFPKVV